MLLSPVLRPEVVGVGISPGIQSVNSQPDIPRLLEVNFPKYTIHWMPHGFNIEVIQNILYIISNGTLEV